MNDAGYIVLWRKLRMSWFSSLSDADFRLAVVCMLMANWCDRSWFDGSEVIQIPRGSFVTSAQKLSDELGKESTAKRVRGGLKRLEKAEFLKTVTKKGRRYTVVTVLNYSQYQDKDAMTGTNSGTDRELSGNREGTDRELSGNREGIEWSTTKPLNHYNHPTNQPLNQPPGPPLSGASEVLSLLNERAGRSLPFTDTAVLKPIVDRLTANDDRPASTVAECALVIDHKCAQWMGSKQEQYLRPKTLFADKHWADYLDAARRWDERGRPSPNATKGNDVGHFRVTGDEVYAGGEVKL